MGAEVDAHDAPWGFSHEDTHAGAPLWWDKIDEWLGGGPSGAAGSPKGPGRAPGRTDLTHEPAHADVSLGGSSRDLLVGAFVVGALVYLVFLR